MEKKLLELSNTERVKAVGHRGYIGGQTPETWYGIGRLQYHFLVSRGLAPEHNFLDIACGALRLGQYLIPFLGKGKYHGIDGEQSLIDAGLANEFNFNIIDLKKPNFSVNYNFDFSFVKTVDYAIAQSLFTHLTIIDIEKCFRSLREKIAPKGRFYFSFFEGDSVKNPTVSHPQGAWRYAVNELVALAKPAGWSVEYIGNWNHPRSQKIAVATPD
jgi:SAM-dependent methyltransferase